MYCDIRSPERWLRNFVTHPFGGMISFAGGVVRLGLFEVRLLAGLRQWRLPAAIRVHLQGGVAWDAL